MIGALLLALALGAWQPSNQCDKPRAPYAPCVGVSVNLWFCGVPASDPVDWDMEIDGVAQPSPGALGLVSRGTAANGLVEYTSPGPLVTLTTQGPHTIRVVYGPDRRVVSFTWIGVTVSKSPIGLPESECPVGPKVARQTPIERSSR